MAILPSFQFNFYLKSRHSLMTIIWKIFHDWQFLNIEKSILHIHSQHKSIKGHINKMVPFECKNLTINDGSFRFL